jgi:hypothetical protein
MAGNLDPTTSGAAPFAADLLRGHTDTIVLGALRDVDRYGYQIYKTIRDATGGLAGGRAGRARSPGVLLVGACIRVYQRSL